MFLISMSITGLSERYLSEIFMRSIYIALPQAIYDYFRKRRLVVVAAHC